MQQSHFDAWGKRNIVTSRSSLKFDRGYTGHEHLDEFGLVNMNGRMYDPLLGRFLSPNPYVNPFSSQGFNRYAYVFNNPMSFTDPSGEWVVEIIVFAAFTYLRGPMQTVTKKQENGHGIL